MLTIYLQKVAVQKPHVRKICMSKDTAPAKRCTDLENWTPKFNKAASWCMQIFKEIDTEMGKEIIK